MRGKCGDTNKTSAEHCCVEVLPGQSEVASMMLMKSLGEGL